MSSTVICITTWASGTHAPSSDYEEQTDSYGGFFACTHHFFVFTTITAERQQFYEDILARLHFSSQLCRSIWGQSFGLEARYELRIRLGGLGQAVEKNGK